jgi:hypothetical protein
MAMTEVIGPQKLVLLAVAVALALATLGCAAGRVDPESSHGVGTAPVFEGEEGGGG